MEGLHKIFFWPFNFLNSFENLVLNWIDFFDVCSNLAGSVGFEPTTLSFETMLYQLATNLAPLLFI